MTSAETLDLRHIRRHVLDRAHLLAEILLDLVAELFVYCIGTSALARAPIRHLASGINMPALAVEDAARNHSDGQTHSAVDDALTRART